MSVTGRQDPDRGIASLSPDLEQRLLAAYGRIMAARDAYPSRKALLIAVAAELDEVEESVAGARDCLHVSRRIDRLIAAACRPA